jgi:hypothetical protein
MPTILLTDLRRRAAPTRGLAPAARESIDRSSGRPDRPAAGRRRRRGEDGLVVDWGRERGTHQKWQGEAVQWWEREREEGGGRRVGFGRSRWPLAAWLPPPLLGFPFPSVPAPGCCRDEEREVVVGGGARRAARAEAGRWCGALLCR